MELPIECKFTVYEVTRLEKDDGMLVFRGRLEAIDNTETELVFKMALEKIKPDLERSSNDKEFEPNGR